MEGGEAAAVLAGDGGEGGVVEGGVHLVQAAGSAGRGGKGGRHGVVPWAAGAGIADAWPVHEPCDPECNPQVPARRLARGTGPAAGWMPAPSPQPPPEACQPAPQAQTHRQLAGELALARHVGQVQAAGVPQPILYGLLLVGAGEGRLPVGHQGWVEDIIVSCLEAVDDEVAQAGGGGGACGGGGGGSCPATVDAEVAGAPAQAGGGGGACGGAKGGWQSAAAVVADAKGCVPRLQPTPPSGPRPCTHLQASRMPRPGSSSRAASPPSGLAARAQSRAGSRGGR